MMSWIMVDIDADGPVLGNLLHSLLRLTEARDKVRITNGVVLPGGSTA